MAHPVETMIMNDIGLHHHYNWFNGSGSCGFISITAVKKLPEVLAAYSRRDDLECKVLPPDPVLMMLAIHVNDETYDDWNLTRTWVACATIIQAHLGDGSLMEATYTQLVTQYGLSKSLKMLLRDYRSDS